MMSVDLIVKDIIEQLATYKDRYRWRPASEIHEGLGPCVLINIEDPGCMALGNNLDTDFEECGWTHFSQIPPLSNEDAKRMKLEISQGEAHDV